MLKKLLGVSVLAVMILLSPAVGGLISGFIAGVLEVLGFAVPSIIHISPVPAQISTFKLLFWSGVGFFTQSSILALIKVILL